ncbi:MAG: DHH family phosphoesterase [Bacillota bacterium]|nr:DHH family phosphoesterase [Bacillota bacterium]
MENKKYLWAFIPRASSYLGIILLLVVILTILKFWIGMAGFALFAFMVFLNIRLEYKRQNELTKYIEDLTFHIDTATKDTLLNFPLPFVVLELDGTIIWYNPPFRDIFGGKDLLEKTITTFVNELEPKKILDGQAKINKNVIINSRNYNVLGNFVKAEKKSEKGEFILMLYLLDDTEFVELQKKYYDEKTCIALIVIDNYDDLMQSAEDGTRPQLLAEVEKKIVNWMSHTGGIIRKFERDKYLFVFECKYLKEFEDKKYEILDTVKEINVGNKIPVTLSLGFGINGKTITENFSNASACIDIALGRGGDHVVIRNGENFSFFGGKTRELEKRTRVKARVIAYALRELIEQAPEVLIMGHEYCDIDCLGAALGVSRIVKNRDKNVHMVLNSSNPTIENILTKIEKNPDYTGLFIRSSEALDRINKKTLLIILDTHRPSFTESPDLIKFTNQIVVIDHHRRGADYIQDAVLTYQETYASSTCELITEILQYVEEKVKLKQLEAEALYAGIVVDTKNFTFKTGVRTFEAASFLRRQGVDTVAVKQLFQNDIETYVNISNVVKNAEIINDKIAISVCPQNVKNAQLISAQAADQLLNLLGITAAFVLSNLGNEVVISGRSLGDINVQMIMEKLGGGGHLSVAGAQLEGISVENAIEKLKCAIIEYTNELNSVSN